MACQRSDQRYTQKLEGLHTHANAWGLQSRTVTAHRVVLRDARPWVDGWLGYERAAPHGRDLVGTEVNRIERLDSKLHTGKRAGNQALGRQPRKTVG